MIHFVSIFCVRYEVGIQLHYYACVYPIVHYCLLKRLSFPIEWSWHPFQKSVECKFKSLFLALNFIPSVHMSILMPVLHCLDYCGFVVSQSWNWVACSVGYSGSFASLYKLYFYLFLFHTNFRMSVLISTEWLVGILIKLGRTDILTVLSLPIHEHGMSLHLFSLIYLISFFIFLV